MTDEPSKLVTAMKVSKKTLKIALQNIVFAIGVKVIVQLLSAIGLASMWAAVFADVGVTFLAVLNSFRALRVRDF
jgi:Cd2+/Zn2+-exporting ATPase